MWLTHLRLQVECSDPAQQGGEFNLTRIHLASYSFFSYSSYSPSPASKLVRSLYVSLSPNLVSRANPACYSSSRPRGSCSFMRDQRSATDSRPVLRKPAAVEASTSKQRVQTSLFVQRRRQCVTIWSAPRTVSTTNIEGHTGTGGRDSAPLKRPAQTVVWCAAQSGVHSVVRQPRPSVSYRSRVLPVRTLVSVLSQWSRPVNALSHSQTKSGLAGDGWDWICYPRLCTICKVQTQKDSWT